MFVTQTEVESETSMGDGMLGQFLETVQQRRPQLLRTARRMTMHPEDAEDVLQEALMKAYRALPRFRGDSKMSTWLSAIVQNTAMEHLRSRRSRLFVSIDSFNRSESGAVEFDLPDHGLTPEESCAQGELHRMLYVEVGRLSFSSRRAIELCALNETSQAEAARMLNTSISSVKAGVFRGKRILTCLIEERMNPPRRQSLPRADKGTAHGPASPPTSCRRKERIGCAGARETNM
ncbi:MAG TPA: RNA polymerase sigma factor [Terracidiphilus sp.]|nr:RNA polymerase sigma factor [Terracidiphilus sp.]